MQTVKNGDWENKGPSEQWEHINYLNTYDNKPSSMKSMESLID